MEQGSLDAREINNQQKDTSSYRSIFKATSLFGGVQVYNILLGIVRTKFVAVFLGTVGVGIMGLLQSATVLIREITALGLSTSAVRDVSEANATNDKQKIGHTIAVLKRLVWLTGITGMVVVLVLAPLISKSSFGNYDYAIPICFLSVTLLLDQLNSGQMVILQGMRRLKNLAKASAIGSTLGTIVSIPLYFWLRINGIVPTLILVSAINLVISIFYAKKVRIDKEKVTTKAALTDGKVMLRMGGAMTVSNVLVYASSYILRAFIRKEGGVEEVGLFVAGFSLMNQYIGMVFTAMTTDYFPRLSAINKDNEKCTKTINQQAEIAILIIAPLMIALVTFVPIIINILYTEDFFKVAYYIVFATAGVLFRSLAWSVAFVFVAKGNSNLYILNETTANIYCLLFNIVGYEIGGLMGLGLATTLGMVLYTIQVFYIAKTRYGFTLYKPYIVLFMKQLPLLVLTIIPFMLFHEFWSYAIGSIILFVSLIISYKGLNNRLGLNEILKNHLPNRS